MRIGAIGMMRPEQLPKEFAVYGAASETSEDGRELIKDGVEKARIKCVLSEATMDERELFSQLQKTVTHTLLQRGSPVANENDTLILTKNGIITKDCRKFRVQGVHDKGGMGIDTAYYCMEWSGGG